MCWAMKSMLASAAVLLVTCSNMADSHPGRLPGPICRQTTCANGQECYISESYTPSCRPSCAVIRCSSGFICKNGQCVEDKCAYIRCKSGTTCKDGQCVPDAGNCATVLCLEGTNCVDGQCYAAAPTCDGVQCPEDQECFLQEVQCFTTPCYPIPTCGPK